MGLLTDLIKDRRAKRHKEEDAEITAYLTVLGDDKAEAGVREQAYEKLTKHAGVSGSNRQMMDKLFEPVLKGNQKQPGGGVPPQIQQLLAALGQQQGQSPAGNGAPPRTAPPMPPNPRGEVLPGAMAGEGPQGQPATPARRPMFQQPERKLSPEEKSELDVQTEAKKKALDLAYTTQLEGVKSQAALKTEEAKYQLGRRFEKEQFDSGTADVQKTLQETFAQIDAGPGSPQDKIQQKLDAEQFSRQRKDALWNNYYGVKTPQVPASTTWKTTEVQIKDGNSVPAIEVGPGKFRTLDGKDIPGDTITAVGNSKTGSSALTGEDKDLKWAMDTLAHPDKAKPEDVEVAKAIKKKWDQGDRSREVHINLSSGKLGEAVQNAKQGDGLGTFAKYEPGGKSVANPKYDPSLEMWAAHYLMTGQTPALGLGGKANIMAKREAIAGRAFEMAADIGISPLEVESLRAELKANAGALNKVTSMGAMTQQFENTVELNMATAEKLSAKWARTGMPFANRIAAAWKTGTGDSEAVNFTAQMHAVANEWAKVMAGNTSAGGTTISSQKDAEAIMSPYLSGGQVDNLFKNVILPDMRNRTAAIQQAKRQLADEIKGIAKPHAQQAPAGPAPGTVVGGFKFKGGDPNDKNNWEQAKK